MRIEYTKEDKKWMCEEVKKLRAQKAFNLPGLRKAKTEDRYYARFKKHISLQSILALFQRAENPNLAKMQYQQYKKNVDLRKRGLLPPSKRKNIRQNTGEILSKYPFIIVIGDRVAGYETEEEAKQAISNSQLPVGMMKMFEVHERKIKAQLLVEIE